MSMIQKTLRTSKIQQKVRSKKYVPCPQTHPPFPEHTERIQLRTLSTTLAH